MPDKRILNLPKKTKRTKPHGTTPALKHAKKAATSVSQKVKAPAVMTEKHCEGGLAADILTVRGDLPELYGAQRVVLMPVDPYLANVYWEIDAEELDSICKRLNRKIERLQPALRLYDLSHSNVSGANAQGCFDIDIDLGAGSWYIHLPGTGRSYYVDVGLKAENGIFFPIVRSNTAEMPRGCTQLEVAEGCIFVSRDEAQRTGINPLVSMQHMPLEPEVTPLQPWICEGADVGDLTAVNEKGFLPGISSLPVPSE